MAIVVVVVLFPMVITSEVLLFLVVKMYSFCRISSVATTAGAVVATAAAAVATAVLSVAAVVAAPTGISN